MEPAIEITMDDVNPDIATQLHDYAERRLTFALRRFQRQLRHVRVRLIDVNGPRRGVDSRCSVTADLQNGHRLYVEATTTWPFRSVTKAAGQMSEAIRRHLGTVRTRSRALPSTHGSRART
jgi:ribosome-associated translation inhibitor RaiA